MQKEYDLVIVGGGMAGASLACLLQPAMEQHKLSVALVESFPMTLASNDQLALPSFDARSSALSWGSRLILEKAGIWPALQAGACAIKDIHVSDKGRFGVTRLNAQHEQVEALGYVVENRWLGQGLLKHLNNNGQLDLLAPATVEQVKNTANGYSLQVDGKTINSKLLILAAGAHSPLYQQLGIQHNIEDYKQHALVVNVEVEQHQHVAFERFTPQGPLALLPLNDNRYAVVWTHTEDSIDETLALDDVDFLAALQKHFGYRAGIFIKAGQRSSYPLQLIKAAEQIRPGLVVMGNGAHAMHPVAGQGFNLSLRDVELLARLISQQLDEGEKGIGDFALLKSYLQQRQWDQQKTIGFSDVLPKLFSHNNPGLALMRDLGLIGMDMAPTTKKLFARQAMGLSAGLAPFS